MQLTAHSLSLCPSMLNAFSSPVAQKGNRSERCRFAQFEVENHSFELWRSCSGSLHVYCTWKRKKVPWCPAMTADSHPPPPPPIFTDYQLFYCILKYKKLMMKFLTHFPCSSAFLSSVSCFSFRWWWPSLRRRWECSTSSWKCLCFIILWSKWNSSC